MKKNTFYYTVIIILVLINIGTLYFSHDKKRILPREIIIEKLDFDSKQIIEYDKIIKEHQKNIRSLDDSIHTTKEKLYALLTRDSINPVEKQNLISKISKFQNEVENTHFNHFLEIKKICKNNQINKFNELSKELSKLFTPKKMPKN
ncbi:MAG: hypothetical protein QM535_04710 [Limnohabitans sp.]|nr:hypothetical protein [Limnohabitans sp.]